MKNILTAPLVLTLFHVNSMYIEYVNYNFPKILPGFETFSEIQPKDSRISLTWASYVVVNE